MNARTVCGIKLRVFISGNQPKGHGEKGFSDRNVIGKHFINIRIIWNIRLLLLI